MLNKRIPFQLNIPAKINIVPIAIPIQQAIVVSILNTTLESLIINFL